MSKKFSLEFAQALAARLFQLRQELGWHQRDMARNMTITERVYRRYEAGEQVPGSDKLSALLDNLKGLNSEWLVRGTGRMFNAARQPELGEVLLDIVENRPSIQRIVMLLPSLDDDDLEGVMHQVMERKKLRELHTELRSMMNRLERPAPANSDAGTDG